MDVESTPLNQGRGRRATAPAVAFVALAAAAAVALSGCAGKVSAAAAPVLPGGQGLELVVGAHANQPVPELPAAVKDRVLAAVRGERAIGVVTVEGRPRVLQPPLPMSVTGSTPDERAASDKRNVDSVASLVHTARPASEGADLMSSLLKAAEAAQTAPDPVHRIIALDNGLSDRGPVNFTVPGMTDANAKDVVSALLKRRTITPTTFKGLTVEFVGLGTTIAAPQTELPASQVSALTAIYSAVVRAGGGTPVLTPLKRSGAGVDTKLPVKAVGKSNTEVTLGGTSALGDGSSVAFQPGTATFRDPGAARRLLTPLAKWLAPGTTHHAVVVGTTSSEGSASKASDLRLSRARAQAVKDVLVSLGADAARIQAQGKGYIADPPDRVKGVLDPAKAAQNRVVRITTTY
jgi:outer membrane protein OmpA-like peptidoglycan-associated protein